MLGINIMIGMFWPCQDFGWMFKCFLSLTISSKNFKSSPSKIRVFSFCWVLTETSLSRADKNAYNDDDDVEGEKHDILVVSRTRGVKLFKTCHDIKNTPMQIRLETMTSTRMKTTTTETTTTAMTDQRNFKIRFNGVEERQGNSSL